MKQRVRWALAALLVLGSAGPALADLPPLISRDILFGNPERSNPQISEDGKLLAYLAPDDKNVPQVWLRTVGKQDDRQLTTGGKRGIRLYFWAQEGTHIIYVQDNDGDENFHLWSVDLKSKVVRDLTPFKGVRAEVVAHDVKFPNELLVGLNLKDKRTFDVYRINLVNGAVDFDTPNPGSVVGWTADARFKVRAATAATPDGGNDVLVRDDAA